MTAASRRWLWLAGWPVRACLLLLIGAYRVTFGQILGGSCRFHPSCSAYAALAISHTGAVRGTALAAWRLLRCTPLSPGGVDYPPDGVRARMPSGKGRSARERAIGFGSVIGRV